jgi:hypothetical protein
MFELNNQIARLELCSEQLRIHLRSLDKASPEADEVRSDLLMMLQKLVALKDRRFEIQGALEGASAS